MMLTPPGRDPREARLGCTPNQSCPACPHPALLPEAQGQSPTQKPQRGTLDANNDLIREETTPHFQRRQQSLLGGGLPRKHEQHRWRWDWNPETGDRAPKHWQEGKSQNGRGSWLSLASQTQEAPALTFSLAPLPPVCL